jgi:hypothetical protein
MCRGFPRAVSLASKSSYVVFMLLQMSMATTRHGERRSDAGPDQCFNLP